VETEQLLTGDTNGVAAKINPPCEAGKVLESRISFEGSNSMYIGAARLGAAQLGADQNHIGRRLDTYICGLAGRFISMASNYDNEGRKTGPASLTVPATLAVVIDSAQGRLLVKDEEGDVIWGVPIPKDEAYQVVVATEHSDCKVKLLTDTTAGKSADTEPAAELALMRQKMTLMQEELQQEKVRCSQLETDLDTAIQAQEKQTQAMHETSTAMLERAVKLDQRAMVGEPEVVKQRMLQAAKAEADKVEAASQRELEKRAMQVEAKERAIQVNVEALQEQVSQAMEWEERGREERRSEEQQARETTWEQRLQVIGTAVL
jgi:hypothetical protein